VRRPSLLAWALLALWSAWLHALQGQWAAASPWAADLGMVLLVVLAARMPAGDLVKGGLAVALGRIAVTIDPPAAVLVGLLVPMAVFGALRSVVVIRAGPARAVLAGLASALLAWWLAHVHLVRAGGSPAGLAASLDPGAWRTALSTALVALVLGPLFALLPGLALVTRRRAWEVAASSR